MSIFKPRALAAAAILGLSTLAAVAQQAPSAPAEGPPPKPEPAPAPQTSPRKPPAAPPSETPAGHDLVGLSVFSSDGTRVGDVRSIAAGPGGKIDALHVRTGGFLGFGGRIVAIPEGSFARKGPNVRLTLSAEEVARLPEVKK